GVPRVHVVAHSMGGLAARYYIQNLYQDRGDIDKLAMLGTPNRGSVTAYYAWEGGDWFGLKGKVVLCYMKDALIGTDPSLLHCLEEEIIPTFEDAQFVQQTIPSVKELLPTRPFLRTQRGRPIPIEAM